MLGGVASLGREPGLERSQNALGADVEMAPMLTPEKVKPEFAVSSGEILVPDNEAKYLEEERFLEATPDDSVNRQECIECRSFLQESDECSESGPADNVSEVSTSVKNYSTVDDEGATPQEELLGKEAEDVVMEIAEKLSQLRSIGKTADSAKKYTLEPDAGMEEDLDSNDDHMMSDLLGPKRLDFEVIDFDQFGAQPPDLPLNDILMNVNHHGGIRRTGASTKANKKPERHAHSGFEQEMKGLNDSPVKILSSRNYTPEKKQQLRKERGAGALDLPPGHVIPRLCNMGNVKEGSRGQDVSRDSDSNSVSGKTGNSKLRPLDSVKPKKLGEAPSGSPIRRSKSTMPDVKGGTLGHEEARKRTEDVQELTHMQAKRLEDCCHRVDLYTAQTEEQSRVHEELNRKLEAECGERLKSEAKLMVLCETLPNVESKLKNLCDQILLMEAQLQEQGPDLRNKLEEALEQDQQERTHLAAKLEEQADLRKTLEEAMEQEHQERTHLAAKLEEQADLRNKLEQERQERMHLAAKLEEQVGLRNKLEEKLMQEREERTQHVAQLQEQSRLHEGLAHKLGEELEDLNNQVESLVAQLSQLDQECKERMEDQTKVHEELVQKVEEGQLERLKSETKLYERLSREEEKVKVLENQVLSLARQLQEEMELRKELGERLDRERDERIQSAVVVANPASESLPVSSSWSEEKIEFAKLLDEQKNLLENQVKEAEISKSATEKKVGLLNHQVENLEVLSNIVETMEYVFSAKDRVIRQTMWTVFQALCLGMGLVNFMVSWRNPLQSSLQPT